MSSFSEEWPSDRRATDAEIHAVSQACLAYWMTHDDEWFRGIEALFDARHGNYADVLLRLALAMCDQVDPNATQVVGHIGVGPIEYLLDVAGEDGLAAIRRNRGNAVFMQACRSVLLSDTSLQEQLEALL